MARLLVMLEVPSNTKLADQEIQAAIWQLADPNLTFPNAPSGLSLTQVNTFENDAKANPLTSGFEVLTDSDNKYQEYVVLTPEPSTFDGGCRPYWFVHVFPKQSHFEKVDSWLVITESATSALDWTDEEQPRGTLRIFPGRGARASTDAGSIVKYLDKMERNLRKSSAD